MMHTDLQTLNLQNQFWIRTEVEHLLLSGYWNASSVPQKRPCSSLL